MTREEAEQSLAEYAAVVASRDDRIAAALAAGVSKNRAHVLSGVARTTINRITEAAIAAETRTSA
jgi:CHASE3 domain sensor protein